jgi:hypothetical protein
LEVDTRFWNARKVATFSNLASSWRMVLAVTKKRAKVAAQCGGEYPPELGEVG